MAAFKKWILLILLFIALVAFYYFDLQQYLTFNTIKQYHFSAQQWTSTHYKSAVLLYLLVFTLLIACTIPCATIFTLLGGFLFGVLGTLYAVFSITLGGVILFLAVRTAIGNAIASRRSGRIKKLERGFQQNAFNYLVMLRLVPVFPCWVSNISAGALNIPLKTFVLATILGIFPSTLIYVLVGRGLDNFFAQNQYPDWSIIFKPTLFFPLLGLIILTLLPIIYRTVKK